MNLLLLVVCGGLWGLHFALMRLVGGDHLSPMMTLFPLLSGVAVVLFLAKLIWPQSSGPVLPHMRFFVISGSLGYLVPFFLELIIAPQLSTALLTFVISTTPLLTFYPTTIGGKSDSSHAWFASWASWWLLLAVSNRRSAS